MAVACRTHQAGVPVVEGAHRRHERDRLTRPARGGEQVGQLLASAREDRGRGHRRSSERAGSGAWRPDRGRGRVEDAEHLRGADRQQPAVGDGAVEGRVRHGDVGRQRLRRVGEEVGDVGPDRLDVTADDRPGQGGVAVLERVVERGGQQWPQGRGRVVGAGGRQDLHGLGDEGDEVVGAVGQACVVERAPVLGHPHRATAEVGDEGLGDLAVGVVGGDAEDAAGQARQVDVGAGEGHRGVHRDGPGTDLAGRLEDGEAVAAARVDDVLALADRAALAQHGHDVGQHVVGHGQQQQVARARDVGRLGDRHTREQRADAPTGGVGLACGGHDLVPGGAERGCQHGADAACADHANTELRHVDLFVSVPRGYRSSDEHESTPAGTVSGGTGWPTMGWGAWSRTGR